VSHAPGRRWVALKVAAYPFLGERVMHSGFDAAAVALGLLCHLAVSLTWGVMFALLVHRCSRAAVVALGAVWGFVVWLSMFVVVLPVVAPTLAEGGGAFGNMVVHILYGLVVAVAFLPFQRRTSESGGGWAREPGPGHLRQHGG
jgi:hypothetical protein